MALQLPQQPIGNPARPLADCDSAAAVLTTSITDQATGDKGRAVETVEGGKDNVPINVNNTKTGYYTRKLLVEGAFWGVGTAISIRRPWVLFRYAEVLLNHVEALNEAQIPVADVYTSINAIRTRVGMPALPAGLTRDQMRDRIQKERPTELCSEDHRFSDVRRRRKGEPLFNRPVTGMCLTKTGTTFTYERFQVENRIFNAKHYYFPIPQTDTG